MINNNSHASSLSWHALDRNKLVFNICSNKNNDFDRPTLDLFFEVSRASYYGTSCPDKVVESSPNPDYWRHLYHKFGAIHSEIQDTSRSINKSFGMYFMFVNQLFPCLFSECCVVSLAWLA
jgi:hypothetical protein